MKPRLLVDTGPLVALFHTKDKQHAWTRGQLSTITGPLHTCEAVVSEALFLLARIGVQERTFWKLFDRDVLRIAFSLQSEHAAVAALMHKYASVPMSLADACLVRMSEAHVDSVLLTFDSDFSVYRRRGRQIIPTLTPA